MKITYLRLKNFLRIYGGLSIYEIEIDFTKCDNRITALVGQNGSCKSTLAYNLHPYPIPLDRNSNYIIEGKDGLKEIHYRRDDGTEYKIEHHYNAKGETHSKKCFIEKNIDGNWVHLNRDGSVREFEDIVEEELSISKDAMKLVSLGADIDNFIQETDTTRKNYMGKIATEISTYKEYYKIVNKKRRRLSSLIDNLVHRIRKIKENNNINRLDEIESDLRTYDKYLNENRESLGNLKGKINTLDPDGSIRKNFQDIENRIQTKRLQLSQYKEKLQSNNEYDLERNGREQLDEIKEKITICIENKKSLDSKYESDFNRQEELVSEVERLKNRLSEFDDGIKLDEVRQLRKYHQNIVDEYSDKFENFNMKVSASDLKNGYHVMKTFKNFVDNFYTNYNPDTVAQADSKSMSNIKSQIQNLTNQLKEMEEKQLTLSRDMYSVKAKEDSSNLLSKRPDECIIDECPFVKDALKNKKAVSEYQKLAKRHNELDRKIVAKVDKIEKLNEIIRCEKDLRQALSIISDEIELMRKMPKVVSYFSNLNKLKERIVERNNYNEINQFQLHIELLDKYEQWVKSKSKLNDLDERIDGLEKTDKLRKELESDLETSLTNLGKKKNDVMRIKGKIIEENHRSTHLNNIYSKIEQGFNTQNTINRLTEEISELETERDKNSENQIKITKIEKEIISINNRISDIQDMIEDRKSKRDKIIADKERLKEFKKDKERFENYYIDYDLTTKAFSNKVGIPLIFMQVYFMSIKSLANTLLSEALGGLYQIKKFKIDEKNFKIECEGPNGIIDDVSEMSSGQKSIIGLCLSFAISYNSGGDYNILILDEMDGPLDRENRIRFIRILEQIMEKLGIEQVIIISHNTAFETYPMDVIKLKGAKLTTNEYSNIIYDYSA